VESYRRYSGGELLQLCRDGDTPAWEEIVARFGSLVYSVPLRLFDLPPEEADEVFQETFLVLLKQLDAIRNPEALSSWLIGVAVRVSKNRLRKAKSRARLLESLEAVGGETEVHAGRELEEVAHMGAALGALDSGCQEILRLRYLVRPPWSYERIAERMGVAVGTIGPWRARCLKRLLVQIRRLSHESEAQGESAGSVS
jgi:RNA polymerase sigma factor (sigma-70 family)